MSQNMEQIIARIKRNKDEALRLTSVLEESLLLEKLVPDIFKNGAVAIRLVSYMHATRYVPCSITEARIIRILYSDKLGNKGEIDLETWAKVKNVNVIDRHKITRREK